MYATWFNTVVFFRGVVLQQNGVAEEGRGKGAGVVRLGREMTPLESPMLDNAASSSGRMYCRGQEVTITACVFEDNVGSGSAVWLSASASASVW